jgi:hypothetical protein
MTAPRSALTGWPRPFWAAVALALAFCPPYAAAQTSVPPGFDAIPRPPGAVGSQGFVPPGGPASVAPSAALPQQAQQPTVANPNPLQLTPPATQPASLPTPPAPQAQGMQPASVSSVPVVPMVPAGQVALMVSARFGRDPPNIGGGLHWRIYPDKPDANGVFRLLKEERAAAPIFVLPPGGYVVHVGFGLATAAKKVQLRSETVREVFEITAGGARFEGRVGDSRIPPGQVTFDVYRGSQFEGEDRRPIASNVAASDVVLLPEGNYHVVSNYGNSNATVRSDIRVQLGKLTDVVVNHRAAVITLKLVAQAGGEALANTQWSVLTPGGDVVKEAVGAFPKVVLAEGEYSIVAKNEDKTFNGKFKVEPGVDREIEVLAR